MPFLVKYFIEPEIRKICGTNDDSCGPLQKYDEKDGECVDDGGKIAIVVVFSVLGFVLLSVLILAIFGFVAYRLFKRGQYVSLGN